MNIDRVNEVISPPNIISYIAAFMWLIVIFAYIIVLFTIKYQNRINNQIILPIYANFNRKLKKSINDLIIIISILSLFIYVSSSFGYITYSLIVILLLHGCILPIYFFIVNVKTWLNIVAKEED